MSVSTKPGQTQFTRTPSLAWASARLLVMLITAALLALYGRLLRLPILPAIDATLTILPRFCAIISGSTAWQAKNTAREVGASRDVGRHDADAAPEPLHLGGGALGPGAVQLGDDEVGPHPRELERGGAADPAARAGNDRDLSRELHDLGLRGRSSACTPSSASAGRAARSRPSPSA